MGIPNRVSCHESQTHIELFEPEGFRLTENFISGFGKTAGNYLPPELLEFLRAELLRCGKALQTLAPALEHENREVKEQARLAATAQFFYSLGLLYTRGLIISPEVPGSSTMTEEPSAVTACEVFGNALERFAREEFLGRPTGTRTGRALAKSAYLFPRVGTRVGTAGARPR